MDLAWTDAGNRRQQAGAEAKQTTPLRGWAQRWCDHSARAKRVLLHAGDGRATEAYAAPCSTPPTAGSPKLGADLAIQPTWLALLLLAPITSAMAGAPHPMLVLLAAPGRPAISPLLRRGASVFAGRVIQGQQE